jgi:hypothetical protein
MEDFPDPDAPTRKTNSPREISRLTASKAGWAAAEYLFETASKRIMAF